MPPSLNSIEIVGGLGTGLVAALCTFLFTPVANRLATRVGAVDHPDHRKLHRAPTPRLGGASIFVGGVAGLAILHLLLAPEWFTQLSLSSELLCLIPGVLLIFLLGLTDDVWGVSAGKKFLVQGLAAGMVLAACGAIPTLNLPFLGSVELGWLGYVVSFLWLVGITNAFNLIDGLDGLAAGVGSIIATFVAVLSFVRGDAATALVAAAVAGACLGFLPRNWAPASTFMGDSGSLTVGFVLAVLTHHSSLKAATTVAVLVPVLALGLPAIDTLLVMGFRFISSPDRRLTRRAVRMFAPDRTHIHHLVGHLTARRSTAVALLYTVVALFCSGALVVTISRNAPLALVLLAMAFVVVLLLRRAGARARVRALALRERSRAREFLLAQGFGPPEAPSPLERPLHLTVPEVTASRPQRDPLEHIRAMEHQLERASTK